MFKVRRRFPHEGDAAKASKQEIHNKSFQKELCTLAADLQREGDFKRI